MLRQGPNVPADVLDGSPAPLRHQHWHRDYPHALDRPMRAGYLHMLCCAPPARPRCCLTCEFHHLRVQI